MNSPQSTFASTTDPSTDGPQSPQPQSTTNVMLVDDHQVIASGLQHHLPDANMDLIGWSSSLKPAMQMLRGEMNTATPSNLDDSPPPKRHRRRPRNRDRWEIYCPQWRSAPNIVPNVDILVVDARLQDEDGFSLITSLRQELQETKFVVITGSENLTHVGRAIASGAVDLLRKRDTMKRLCGQLRRVADNLPQNDSSIFPPMRRLLNADDSASKYDMEITNRELQVLRHLCLGLSNAEIATSMAISVETVKEHVQNLLRKLNVADRTAAAVLGLRRRVLPNSLVELQSPDWRR
ncbi:MAG: response regulator transcription factor [Planctomycetota bacterium]